MMIKALAVFIGCFWYAGSAHAFTYIIPHGIVCASLNDALSIQSAFLSGQASGWRRVAIEQGRARMYGTLREAIASGVCLYRRAIPGSILTSASVKRDATRAGTTVTLEETIYSMRVDAPQAALLGRSDVHIFLIKHPLPTFLEIKREMFSLYFAPLSPR